MGRLRDQLGALVIAVLVVLDLYHYEQVRTLKMILSLECPR